MDVLYDEVLFESNVQYDNITVYFYFSTDASTLTNTSVYNISREGSSTWTGKHITPLSIISNNVLGQSSSMSYILIF